MPNNRSLGKIGEDLAAQYLIDNGYDILERNWKSNRKEIDIIALDCRVLVFIEVKTRQNDEYGEPELAVNRKKRIHLFSVANSYIYRHKIDLDVRFDIISILYHYGNPEINHIIDAFHFI